MNVASLLGGTASNLTTVPLATQRRLLTSSLIGNPDGNDVVAAARQRLAQAQADHMQALQYSQQQKAIRQQQKQMQQAMMNMHQTSSMSDLVYRGGPYSASTMPMPKGKLSDWIMQAIAATPGTGRQLIPGLTNMIMHESAGNPRAINNWDSNAKAGTPSIGLMQTIGPTFNAYAMKGHRDIYNPVDNIIAGLRYAISRYGKGMIKAGGRHDKYGNYIGY